MARRIEVKTIPATMDIVERAVEEEQKKTEKKNSKKKVEKQSDEK